MVYNSITLHTITEFYTKWFSVCPNITSKFRTTAIFKSSVKENNGSNKTYRYIHDLSLNKFQLSKCNDLCVVSIKQNVNFKFKPHAMFELFSQSGLTKSCSCFEDMPVYKIPWSHVD
jgi:restriction endonuclease S subunit